MIEELQHAVDSFMGLPGFVLVGIVCLVIGYCLRAIKRFPNEAIPLTCILVGGIMNVLMRGDAPTGMRHRVWICQNLALGVVVGFIVWRLHAKILKKLESKVPWLMALLPDDQTKFFSKITPVDDTKIMTK